MTYKIVKQTKGRRQVLARKVPEYKKKSVIEHYEYYLGGSRVNIIAEPEKEEPVLPKTFNKDFKLRPLYKGMDYEIDLNDRNAIQLYIVNSKKKIYIQVHKYMKDKVLYDAIWVLIGGEEEKVAKKMPFLVEGSVSCIIGTKEYQMYKLDETKLN